MLSRQRDANVLSYFTLMVFSTVFWPFRKVSLALWANVDNAYRALKSQTTFKAMCTKREINLSIITARVTFTYVNMYINKKSLSIFIHTPKRTAFFSIYSNQIISLAYVNRTRIDRLMDRLYFYRYERVRWRLACQIASPKKTEWFIASLVHWFTN